MSFKVEMIGGEHDGEYWDLGGQIIDRGYVEFCASSSPVRPAFALGDDIPAEEQYLRTEIYTIREIRFGYNKYWFVAFKNPKLAEPMYIDHVNDKVQRYMDLLSFRRNK